MTLLDPWAYLVITREAASAGVTLMVNDATDVVRDSTTTLLAKVLTKQ